MLSGRSLDALIFVEQLNYRSILKIILQIHASRKVQASGKHVLKYSDLLSLAYGAASTVV